MMINMLPKLICLLFCFFTPFLAAQTPLEFAKTLVTEDSLDWVKEITLDSVGWEHWYLDYGWGLYYQQDFTQMKKLGAAVVARTDRAFGSAGPDDYWIKRHYYTGLATYWQFHTMEGHYREGTREWERVLVDAERELGLDIKLSHSYVGLGIAYSKFGDPYRALWAHHQAARVLEANVKIGDDNYYLLGNKFNNLALTYLELQQPEQAVALYRKAASIYEDAGVPTRAAIAELKAALAYLEMDDWVSAERIVDSILSLSELWDQEPRLKGWPLYTKAMVSEKKGEVNHAMDFYRQAIRADKFAAKNYEYFGPAYEGFFSEISLKFVQLQRSNGELAKALARVNQAIERWLCFTNDPNSSSLINLQLEKLEILRLSGKYAAGLDLADLLIFNLSEGTLCGWESPVVAFNPEMLSVNLIQVLTGRATLLFDATNNGYDQVESADVLRDCEMAKAMIATIRESYAPDFQFGDLIEDNQRIYDIATALHFVTARETGKYQPYLNALEAAKQIQLSENLGDQDYLNPSQEQGGLLQLEARLRKDLRVHERLLDAELNAPEASQPLIEKLRAEMIAIKASQDSVQQALTARYGKHAILASQEKSIGLETIRQTIKIGELLCTYYWGSEQVFGLCIASDTIIPFSVEHKGMEQRIEVFRSSISDPSRQALPDSSWQKNAYELYRDLLGKHLGERLGANTDRLIIIPDGPLHLVAWPALLTELKPTVNNWRKLPYLMRQNALVSESSVAHFFSNNSAPSVNASYAYDYLGFAPSYQGTEVSQRGTTTEQSRLKSIFPAYERRLVGGLKYNQREVSQAGSNFSKQRTFLAETATEAQFKKTANEARVLHVATHGLTNDEDPSRSHLVFSVSKNNEVDDGRLFSYEIYDMRIPAQLAVLSACETGDGSVRTGAGIMSLARAFKFAGCQNVLMTRWPANDLTTYRIITNFMEQIKDGVQTANALTTARINHLENAEKEAATHPYYWAGTSLVGNGLSLPAVDQPASNWWWLLLAMPLLLLFLFKYY
jgi:CHAT domain-containing protein/tetratricopeptide (TPR) repeat protein